MGLSVRPGGGITYLVLNRAKIESFNLPGGMTYKWTRDIVLDIEEEARASLWPGHGYRTGDLWESIGHSVTPTHGGVVGNVRATADHALYYHEGTPPHMIPLAPKGPKRWLRWSASGWDSDSGPWVWKKQVLHPGNRAHPFIREAMEEVLARRGIAI